MVKLIIIEAFFTQNILFQKVLDCSLDHIYREISDLTGDHWLGASDPYLAVSVSTLTLSETVILL